MADGNVIRVDGLGKQYRLGVLHHDRLADALTAGMGGLLRGVRRLARRRAVPRTGADRAARQPAAAEEHIWALKDVSFDVPRGEVLGIIGKNGAGKSTLLKILTGIAEPTEGRAVLQGRIASLLEVGTGFHPELTGRENVFLNGAVLGMPKAEIVRKFDEIVAFAEVESFIDTPVKRYSSGMYVRLAFAVAAHLEPEILLVDEVLAVGDVQFQRKCLGKMRDVSGQGRTVLFVSHNMGAISGLCTKALLLDEGRVSALGPVQEVVGQYLAPVAQSLRAGADIPDCESLGYTLRVLEESTLCVRCGEPVTLVFDVACPGPVAEATAGLVLISERGERIVGMSSKVQGRRGSGSAANWRFVCRMGSIPLNAGHYDVVLYFGTRDRDLARFEDGVSLYVEKGDPFGWGNAVPYRWGNFYWAPEWEMTGREGSGIGDRSSVASDTSSDQ